MTRPLPLLGQAVVYALIAALLGHFSSAPAYRHADPGQALIKLSFNHAAQRRDPCRELTDEDLARLAPNMRRPLDCPRARLPVVVELVLDGTVLYHDVRTATGLWDDGPATVYQRFPVRAGPHRVTVRLRDSARTQGFDYESHVAVDLAPQQNFVIDFRAETGGFHFR